MTWVGYHRWAAYWSKCQSLGRKAGLEFSARPDACFTTTYLADTYTILPIHTAYPRVRRFAEASNQQRNDANEHVTSCHLQIRFIHMYEYDIASDIRRTVVRFLPRCLRSFCFLTGCQSRSLRIIKNRISLRTRQSKFAPRQTRTTSPKRKPTTVVAASLAGTAAPNARAVCRLYCTVRLSSYTMLALGTACQGLQSRFFI